MFDRLIVTEPDRTAVRNRRSYFLVSSVVVGVLFITAVVVSIFAADLSLGSSSFELTEMLAPVELAAAAAPEPVRQPRPTQAHSTSEVAIRQVAMQDVRETPRVPDAISTTPNTAASRPLDSRYVLGDHDTNPSNVGVTGRDYGDREPGVGTGIAVSERKPDADDGTPPPAHVETPKRTTVVSKGVINGIAQALPKPVYSAAARAVRAQGKVDVQVTIDEAGRVVSAHAASGHPLLRDSAETAARQARFSPTKLSEVAVRVTGVIVYNFIP